MASTSLFLGAGGGIALPFNVPASDYISFGSAPSTSGPIRLTNGTYITQMDASGEVTPLMGISALSEIEFGKYNPTTAVKSLYFYAGASGSINFYTATTTVFAATATYCRFLTARLDWRPAGSSAYYTFSDRLTVQTTDATATSLVTLTQDDTCVCKYTANVTAFEPATSDSLSVTVEATYKRNGGAATIVGAVVNTNRQQDAGAATWVVTFDTSTNDVRLRVTGEAAHTINWRATVSMAKG